MMLLPESPYQLIKDKKIDEAKQSIKWLRRKLNVEDDFLSMKADVERQMSESGTWKDLINIESNRKALRAGLFLRCSQQFSGITVFSMYTQIIFQKAGSSISPEISSISFLAAATVLNLLFSLCVEKFGRRSSFFISILSCGLVLLIMSGYFIADQYGLITLSWFPLAGMITYVVAFAPGVSIVPTLMLGELFSSSIKSKGLCVLVFAFGASIFLTSNVFRLLNNYVGLYGPFLVYGLSCLLASILTLRWVPETKGRTLEEIQQDLKRK